jgi:hypothetical protein
MPTDLTKNPNREWIGRSGLQRAAFLGYMFAKGGEYTTMEIAQMLGYIHRQNAIHLLYQMQGVLPIVRTGSHREGKWHLMRGHNENT